MLGPCVGLWAGPRLPESIRAGCNLEACTGYYDDDEMFVKTSSRKDVRQE
jgi:hypothetical protein